MLFVVLLLVVVCALAGGGVVLERAAREPPAEAAPCEPVRVDERVADENNELIIFISIKPIVSSFDCVCVVPCTLTPATPRSGVLLATKLTLIVPAC